MGDTLTNRRFSIAPMMDWSDHNCRYFWRLLTRQALLYTEMVTTGALIHGDRERFLHFNAEEHPVALQLGGSDPKDLARCARWAQEWGYDEINLNCGCPSDRVQSGMFGACLMARPDLVADCVKAMVDSCDIPVTVKHRIGIDHMETYDELLGFVEPVAAAGCSVFIVHARKAWLQGLSPKGEPGDPAAQLSLGVPVKKGLSATHHRAQWRHPDTPGMPVPPAARGRCHAGQGGLPEPVDAAQEWMKCCSGWTKPLKSRDDVIAALLPYTERQLAGGAQLNHITRHILGLYQGVPGARKFRRHLSENAYRKEAGIEVLTAAHALVSAGYDQQT